jgi:hypothetical protein
MENLLSKSFFIIFVNLLLSLSVSAKTKEQKEIQFPIRAEQLLKGEVHFFFDILSPSKLAVQQGELFELDSLSLAQESDVEMVVTKHAYIVKKPAGFFDDQQLSDERYISHIMGDQKVKKLGPAAYSVSVPGGPKYRMQLFFDADDVSTLPNSKVIRGVNAVKKIDVISKGASAIMFVEKTNFQKDVEGGVSVSSFIPLNERRTLIVTYNLYAVNKRAVKRKAFKHSFMEEIGSLKKLQDNFKEN